MLNILFGTLSVIMVWVSHKCAALLPLLAFFFVRAIPTSDTINSDLDLLIQNDLDWPTASAHESTILLKPQTHSQAIAACSQLSEGLLQTNGTYFQSDIKNLIQYREYLGTSLFQNYWVASSSSEACQAVSVLGIHTVSCDEIFPAFCSNSAPNRISGQTDLSSQYQIQVNTGELQVQGTRDHFVFRFLGIPYANPITERWTYSDVFSGNGVINALNFGSPCIQTPGTGSEDCLFLNIFTPYIPQSTTPKTSGNLKPVMFWIHGGAFTGGEGSDAVYDGGSLSSRGDVVVVTINYRLSALGFLALNDGKTNGNYGLADQITALKWVNQHIADFGGDPSRVTIFGQSAGAASVRALLAAPPAFGLFAGAIAQSNLDGFGYASTYSNYYTVPEEVSVAALPFLSQVGCDDSTDSDTLICLKAASADTLVNAPSAPRFVVVDGTYITTNQLELNGKGPTAKAHVIFGWMHDDGCDFIGSFPTDNETEVSDVIIGTGISTNLTTEIIASGLFPVPGNGTSPADIFNVTSRIATDGEFRCLDQASQAASAKNDIFESAWVYQFDRSSGGYEPIPGICDPPATSEFPNGDPSLPYYRCHSGDLNFMFGNFGQAQAPFRDSNDLLFSQLAVDFWTSFARTFNPNPSFLFLAARGYTNTTASLLEWGQWNEVTTSASAPLRLLDIPLKSSSWLETAQCELLGYPLSFYYK